jgi:ABC-type Fe3+ transport system permease subunit
VTGNSDIASSNVVSAEVNGAAQLSGPVLRYFRLLDYPLVALSTAVIVVVGLLVLPPIWTLLRTSFANTMPDLSTAGFTLDNYFSLVTGRNLAISAVNTIVFATSATTLSLIIGGLLNGPMPRSKALRMSPPSYRWGPLTSCMSRPGSICWAGPDRSTIFIAPGSIRRRRRSMSTA